MSVTKLLLLLSAIAAIALAVPTPAGATDRTIVVDGSLQAAIDAALPGDVLVLRATSYAEPLTLTRPGTAGQPITLKGSGIGKTVLNGTLRIRASAAFWHIQDLDVNAWGGGDGVRIDAPAHDISLLRLHIYSGRGYGVRVGSDTANVRIEDSQIDHFDAGDADAHGIGIMTAANVTIRGCDIHHNSGDAIQVNTPDYPGYGRFASNILIERNTLHEDRENALDIKSTHGLSARHNRMWGYGAVSSSDGMAIQVQYDAQDITIVGNEVAGAIEGIEVSRGRKNGVAYPLAPRRVLIAGNLFRNLIGPAGAVDEPAAQGAYRVMLPLALLRPDQASAGDGGRGTGIVIRASAGVRVYNNTVLGAPRIGLYLASSGKGDYPSTVDARNNVLEGADDDLALAFAPSAIAGLTVDYNHYVNGHADGGSMARWLAQGYEHHPSSGDPKLDASFHPRAGSPLLDSGVNVGLPFSGTAPDRGWGEL
jgi:hypothetical protein